jgi:hypothetical protein
MVESPTGYPIQSPYVSTVNRQKEDIRQALSVPLFEPLHLLQNLGGGHELARFHYASRRRCGSLAALGAGAQSPCHE